MKKSVLLGACSIIASFAVAQAAAAQQGQATPPSPATQAQTPNEKESLEGDVPVPANSDAAEQAEARRNVEREDAKAARAGNPDARQAESELRRYQDRVVKKTKGNDDILVTGSRLRDGDQTSRLIVIDAKEIRDRGVTSVEELIRTLPQNVATIGTITNSRSKGPLNSNAGTSGNQNIVSDVGSVGLSAANLGGVGAGNTLVLVNGRRIAGAAGVEQGYVNLNGIPLSAIERVEISTGGQSAIYGADAMGGVINFILKKNYVGTTVSASHRETSAGSRDTRISLYSGRAWGSGSIAGTLEFGRIDPIVNAKTGYVTSNYAPLFNNNPAYDRRSLSNGTQPGTALLPGVYNPATGQFVQSGLTVPEGFTGAPKRSDLIPATLSTSRDYVPTYAGPRTRTVSGTLNFEQKITDRLSVYATGLYTRSRNTQANNTFGGLSVGLAPGQYYNPFPAFTLGSSAYASTVYYFPGSEIADGSLVPTNVRNTVTAWTANAGVSYDFGKLAKIQINYTRSQTSTEGSGTQLGSLVSFQRTVTNGVVSYPCYNFLLANNRIPANRRAATQAAFQAQCTALTSTDPNVAFNPWRSNAAGGGASINTFLYPYVVDDLGNALSNVEGRVTGAIAGLPAGAINYAVGAEYSTTALKNSFISDIAGPNPSTDRYAFFGEINLPILGKDYTLPFARRLLFNIAMRRDVNSSVGAIGTVNRIPVDQGGEIIYGKNRFGRTTPSWGMLWSPTTTIDIRAKFTRGFKAPPPTQLYSVQGTTQTFTSIVGDPLYTCTVQCGRPQNGQPTYVVPLLTVPNPNLRPETSSQQIYSAAWQPTGALSGLSLSVAYNRNRIRNQFATTRELYFYLPAMDVLKLPLFFPRDPVTNRILSQNNVRYNIVGSEYESLTYEASYLFTTNFGTFQPKITYLDNIVAKTIGLTDAQVIDQRGRILGVDKYKVVGSLQWNWNKVSTNIYVYHTPSYLNDYMSMYAAGVQTNPELITRVKPLTTVDLSVSWVVTNRLNIQFAGRNIFKAAAPFTVVDSLPYDTSRYNIEGRSLMLSTRLSF